MKKYTLAYLLTVLVFGAGIVLVLRDGSRLEQSRPPAAGTELVSPASSTPAPTLLEGFREKLHEPLSLLLMQLILIVLLARVFGALFVGLGQPAVIGEMLAGVVLGPSVFGALFNGAYDFVFPANSLGVLRMLSQVGVILFMFVVGMELDVLHLRRKANTAILVSHVGILFPLFLGVTASWFIFADYGGGKTSFIAFALFMGISMSVTAFPVLARIIEERGLSGTFLGTTAISCAAVSDVSAWILLAFVVALVKAGGWGGTVLMLFLAVLFLAAMFLLARPLLNQLIASRPRLVANPTRGVVVGILVLVFGSALFTEVIGIHALFGAFLAGVAMPAYAQFRLHLREKLENFSSAFLLPLFFAFIGLRTQIGLLDDWTSWAVCLGLILVATIGKLGGSMAAARFSGMDWHDSFTLGALMNTRGLVELIVLNLGLDLGILSPRIFAMLVIMALFTTFMTGPLLSLARVFHRAPAPLGTRTA
jgi:Kef-type K+ transport system membrane component KefB